MASIFKLPVVFVCENNMYGISVSQKYHMNISDVSDRALAYGIPGVTVDGNDVIAIYEAAAEAIHRARKGDGPSLIECKTWRHKGHFEGDPQTYKAPEEQAEWIGKDPIPRLEQKLLSLGYAQKADLEKIKAEKAQVIEAAVRFAETSPEPAPADVLTDVYAD